MTFPGVNRIGVLSEDSQERVCFVIEGSEEMGMMRALYTRPANKDAYDNPFRTGLY